MRKVVAIAIVATAAMLSGCADDTGGPRVAPPPDPAATAEAPATAPGKAAGRAARSTLTTRPTIQAEGTKTALP